MVGMLRVSSQIALYLYSQFLESLEVYLLCSVVFFFLIFFTLMPEKKGLE